MKGGRVRIYSITMISYLFYSSIVLLNSSVRMLRTKYSKKVKYYFTFILMFLITGFRRFDVGNDTQSYLSFFEEISYGNYIFDPRIEYGYRLFNRFVALWSDNFMYLLVLTAAFFFWVLSKVFKSSSPNELYASTLFWLIGFMKIMDVTRQVIATAIIYIGFAYLMKNRKMLYIVFCVIASLFHSSAIVLIFLIFLVDLNMNPKKTLIVMVGSITLIMPIGILDFLVTRFIPEYYLGYYNIQSGITAVIFNSLLGLSFIIYDDLHLKLYKKPSNNTRLYRFTKWSTLAFSAFSILSYRFSISGRLGYYFIPAMIIYMTIVCKRNKILQLITITILLIYNVSAIAFRPEWNSFFPHFFVWQQDLILLK